MEQPIAARFAGPAGQSVYRHDLAPKAKVGKDLPVAMPGLFAPALRKNPAARVTSESLVRTYERHDIDWLARARRDQPRVPRLAEAMPLRAQGRKLPLK